MKNYLFSMNDSDHTIVEDVLDLKTAVSELLYDYTNDEGDKDLFLKSCEKLNNSETISLLNVFLNEYGQYVENVYELSEKIY